MKIGVISDTHNLLDPKVLGLFDGVQHIVHGGDIGLPWLIFRLQSVAPVTAVGDNTDSPELNYPDFQSIELATQRFLVHHIVNPHALFPHLQPRIAKERPQVVIFGHTHKPFCEEIGGRLFFNPGYAGKSRFGMERTVAILHCDEQNIRPEYFRL